jgi:hypothetical protein
LRTRIEAEQRALADAQRREFAASELAIAATARANKQEELARLARERAEAERRAANLANEKLRAEQVAEASALACMAAENEAAREAKRRAEQETEAGHAAAVRLEAEHEASMARAERMAAEAEAAAAAASHQKIADALAAAEAAARPPEATTDKRPSNPRLTSAQRRLLASTALALMAGVGVGLTLHKAPRFPWGLSSTGQDSLHLRLDDNLTSFAARPPRPVPRDRTPPR